MGLATLQVWFTEEGSCHISEHEPDYGHAEWQVAVMHCDGTPLRWCETTYVGIPAKCGHAEIKVPPGCYIVRGAEGMQIDPNNPNRVIGNHMSDHAVVTACCDKEICVTLFVPSAHNCVFSLHRAVRDGLAVQAFNPEIGRRALAVLQELQTTVKPATFDRNAQEVMDKMIDNINNPPKKKKH